MSGDYPRFCLALILCSGLAACGGGGGGGGDDPGRMPPQPDPIPSIQSGVFKDTNVNGLKFVSGEQSGTTGIDGRYTCETGSDVSFAVGAVSLGSALCTTLLSPPALVASGQFDDPEAVNIARFLQVLDADAIPANGITISADLQAVAESWPTIDFTAADLDSELTMVFADIQSVDNRTVTSAPSAGAAFTHMDEVLACAYGGVFVGSLAGSNEGTVAFVLGRRQYGFSPDEFGFMAYDPEEEFVLSTGGRFTFSANSILDSSPFDQSVIVKADLTDPDHLSGTWNYPPESRSGTLSASRRGDDTGILRFSGEFFATESRGVLTISVDENGVFDGIALDVVDNSEYQISGERPEINPFDLTIRGNGSTLTASTTVSIDSFGIYRLDGAWNDGTQSGGNFSAAGCVLNPLP